MEATEYAVGHPRSTPLHSGNDANIVAAAVGRAVVVVLDVHALIAARRRKKANDSLLVFVPSPLLPETKDWLAAAHLGVEARANAEPVMTKVRARVVVYPVPFSDMATQRFLVFLVHDAVVVEVERHAVIAPELLIPWNQDEPGIS
jgi:hypothetical protein